MSNTTTALRIVSDAAKIVREVQTVIPLTGEQCVDLFADFLSYPDTATTTLRDLGSSLRSAIRPDGANCKGKPV